MIHGPTSANWDIDVGVVMLSDWIHLNAFVVFSVSDPYYVDGRPLTCLPAR